MVSAGSDVRAVHYRGFRALWARERRRAQKAGSTWVMIALTIMMAVTSVAMAKWSKQLLIALSDEATGELLAQSIPEPSVTLAYQQWVGNLDQLLALVLIVLAAQHLTRAVRSGDIPFILSRNVGRGAYLSSAELTPAILIILTATLGSALTWAGASIVFGEVASPAIIGIALVWIIRLILVCAVSAVIAIRYTSVVGASAAGIATHLLLAIGSLWEPAERWSFFGLGDVINRLMVADVRASDAVVCASALIVAGGLIALSHRLFLRRELD